jgi:hypothetical protein
MAIRFNTKLLLEMAFGHALKAYLGLCPARKRPLFMAVGYKSRFARSSGILTVVPALAVVTALAMPGPAFSDQTLKSARQPVRVENRTPMDVKTVKPGDTFEGVLTENYHFGSHTLPAGTVLRGSVHKAHHSRPFGRPGYVQLNVREARLPSGASHTFVGTDGHPGLTSHKIKDGESLTLGQIILVNLPLAVASAGTSIPLIVATDLSNWSIFGITESARLGTGVLLEGTPRERKWHDRRQHALPTRVGHGLLRGTGLVALYEFLWPAPNPDLARGVQLPLRFNKEELNSLFATDNAAVNVPTNKGPASALP